VGGDYSWPASKPKKSRIISLERERERAKWLCFARFALLENGTSGKRKSLSDEIVFMFPWHDLHRWTRVCVGPLAAQQVDSWKLEAIRGWSFDCGGLCVCCACVFLSLFVLFLRWPAAAAGVSRNL
jgi:hypothetical protein